MDYSVKILKWEKHQRKDVKRPTWFALDNSLVEDDEFFKFNHGEFKTWIYLLSKASKKQHNDIEVDLEAAERKSKIDPKDFKAALVKLKSLGIIEFHVTRASRGRRVDVTPQTNKQDKHNKTIHNTKEHVPPAELDFSEIYNLYPRKEGGTAGLKKLKSMDVDQETFNRIKTAAIRYSNHCRKNKTEPKFIKHFSTWVNNWTDWDDVAAGSTITSSKNYDNERDTDHDAEMKEIWGA